MGYHRPSAPLGGTEGRRAGCLGVNKRETQGYACSLLFFCTNAQPGWVGGIEQNLAVHRVAFKGVVKKYGNVLNAA
jgi:hypothetical protein